MPADAPLAERRSMAYAGCLVAAGQGEGVVVGTGDATEIGRIGRLLSEVETLTTPLLRAFAAFGQRLSVVILVLAALVFLFGWLVRGIAAEEMLLAAVGIAVAAIPEGLPAVLTIALAIGVERMARRNAIVRQLPAVETLGAVSVICTDKTGTLTRNEMSVTSVALADATVPVGGTGHAPEGDFDDGSLPLPTLDALRELAKAGLLCNEARLVRRDDRLEVDGDPTEGALIVLALRAGLDPAEAARVCPRLDLLPFAAETRLMATLHGTAGQSLICLKGAPEVVLPRCTAELASTGPRPLEHEAWRARLEAIAARAERPLAIAVRPLPGSRSGLDRDDLEGGFLLLGIVGIADPVRPEAVDAIRRCRSAGIRVKMITGDHPGTARAIAGTLGLANSAVALTGPDLDRLDDLGLESAAEEVDVFARTSPEHKLRLVSALQARGRIVAMTGDGVNDAPALKRADVGIAMGRAGTEAAKQAAKMVLADDNFASIANAVEEGRTVHDNLKKAILFILPTNAALALAIVAAILLGLELPITPLQILWVNMITAVTLALALAFEAAEGDVMARPPRRPDEPLLSGLLAWRVLLVSLLLVAATFGIFLWRTAVGDPPEAARTAAVNEHRGRPGVLPLRHPPALRAGLHARSAARPRRRRPRGRPAAALHLPAPLQQLFGTTALGVEAWLGIVAGGAIVLLAVELEKQVLHRRLPKAGLAKRQQIEIKAD